MYRIFTKCIYFIFSKHIFLLFSIINEYIEGIIKLIMQILKYILEIDIKNEYKENIQSVLNKLQPKEYKKYVQIHNWANYEIDNKLKYIIFKPLRWRPTIINK